MLVYAKDHVAVNPDHVEMVDPYPGSDMGVYLSFTSGVRRQYVFKTAHELELFLESVNRDLALRRPRAERSWRCPR